MEEWEASKRVAAMAPPRFHGCHLQVSAVLLHPEECGHLPSPTQAVDGTLVVPLINWTLVKSALILASRI